MFETSFALISKSIETLNLLSQKTQNDECVFQEHLSKQFCDNYMSKKHLGKKLMLGVMRTGTVVAISENSAKDTSKYATHFITKMATT
jgi:hypothetical protein